MPLRSARSCKSKKCRHRVISGNISELHNANKSLPARKKRSHEQIVAIAIRAASGGKKKK